jgi:hypothetical protein
MADKEHPHPEPPPIHKVEIHVNERPVHVVGPRMTGHQIKEAAVQQGVAIQSDFVLSEEIGNRRTRVVGDDEIVTVNSQSRFIAVAPDDNS